MHRLTRHVLATATTQPVTCDGSPLSNTSRSGIVITTTHIGHPSSPLIFQQAAWQMWLRKSFSCARVGGLAAVQLNCTLPFHQATALCAAVPHACMHGVARACQTNPR